MIYDNNDFLMYGHLANQNMHHNSAGRFFTPSEGLLRGNMFKDEFKPYKNIDYLPLVPKNEKEAMFLKVYEYDFAVNDLALFLNLNPSDKEAFELFKTCCNEYEKAKTEYERMYGPICLEDTKGMVYNWTDNPWPWEKDKGDMYV